MADKSRDSCDEVTSAKMKGSSSERAGASSTFATDGTAGNIKKSALVEQETYQKKSVMEPPFTTAHMNRTTTPTAGGASSSDDVVDEAFFADHSAATTASTTKNKRSTAAHPGVKKEFSKQASLQVGTAGVSIMQQGPSREKSEKRADLHIDSLFAADQTTRSNSTSTSERVVLVDEEGKNKIKSRLQEEKPGANMDYPQSTGLTPTPSGSMRSRISENKSLGGKSDTKFSERAGPECSSGSVGSQHPSAATTRGAAAAESLTTKDSLSGGHNEPTNKKSSIGSSSGVAIASSATTSSRGAGSSRNAAASSRGNKRRGDHQQGCTGAGRGPTQNTTGDFKNVSVDELQNQDRMSAMSQQLGAELEYLRQLHCGTSRNKTEQMNGDVEMADEQKSMTGNKYKNAVALDEFYNEVQKTKRENADLREQLSIAKALLALQNVQLPSNVLLAARPAPQPRKDTTPAANGKAAAPKTEALFEMMQKVKLLKQQYLLLRSDVLYLNHEMNVSQEWVLQSFANEIQAGRSAMR
ncbi:unnamed protein product [Amoebophrya sp. A120]|nr:unnamed protein product [Amoebophrya sp. A120]|eukprot:GSA120T00001755001.1